MIAELSDLLAFEEFRLLGRGELKTTREGSVTIPTGAGAYEVSLRFERDDKPDQPVRVERFELIHKPKSGKQRVVLSNALSVALGETVVVGTSKPGPTDRAVVVLVTAVKPAVAADVAARHPRAGKEVASPAVPRREN